MEPERKTFIIVPCYNEGQRLNVTAFQRFCEEDPGINFIFVDDGSLDDTGDILKKLCADSPKHFQLLSLDRNRGKAAAVRLGILLAIENGCEYTGYWDADLSTPLSEILHLLHVLENQRLDIAIGSRVKILGYNIQRHLIRHLAGRIFATVASNTLNLPVYDTQCGAKIFRNNSKLKKVFNDILTSNWSFDVEVIRRYILINSTLPADEQGHFIEEVPLRTWKDTSGSKVKLWDFFVALYELVKIYLHYRRPAIRQYYLTNSGS